MNNSTDATPFSVTLHRSKQGFGKPDHRWVELYLTADDMNRALKPGSRSMLESYDEVLAIFGDAETLLAEHPEAAPGRFLLSNQYDAQWLNSRDEADAAFAEAVLAAHYEESTSNSTGRSFERLAADDALYIRAVEWADGESGSIDIEHLEDEAEGLND